MLVDQRLGVLSAIELGWQLAALSAIAMSEIILAIIRGSDMSQQDALQIERQAVLHTLGNEEGWEGMTAFLQTRKTAFKDS